MICEKHNICKHKLECDHAIPHTHRTVCTHTGCSLADDKNVRCRKIMSDQERKPKEEPVIQKLEELADQTAKKDAGKLRYDLIEGSALPDLYAKYPFEYLKPGALTLSLIDVAIEECMFIIGSHTRFLEELAKVYTFGCTKYSERSWQSVPNGRARYESAIFRHIKAYKDGEWTNWEDGGCLHIAQIAFNLLAVKWFITKESK